MRDWREETQLHYFKKGKAPDQGPPVSRLTVDAGSQGASVTGGSGRTPGKAELDEGGWAGGSGWENLEEAFKVTVPAKNKNTFIK